MVYDSWDMGHNRHNFFCHFEPIFALMPLRTWKIKISKKWKKRLLNERNSLCTSVRKIMMYEKICCTVPEIWHMTDVIFIFYFELFFDLLYSKNQNFQKRKKRLEIPSFCTCIPKIMITWCRFPEIWCTTEGRTDGWTGGWLGKKRHIEVGWCPT